MGHSLKHIAVVSISTMGSRVLGLLRDVLVFALLGVGTVNSAFLFAFTIPNLFRRLFGEGALTSALIPVLSSELEEGGRPRAFQLFNQVLTLTVTLLIFLVLGGVGVMLCIWLLPGLPQRWHLGALLGMALMPYMILVCVAALLAATLNVLGRFAVAALSQVWLNLAMIVALGGLGVWLGETPLERVVYLCGGVLVGGLAQMLIPAADLWRQGWRPQADFEQSEPLRRLITLFIPAVFGAAIYQINIVVSRVLALALNETAVGDLYIANRLVELPLGVFAIAVTTVFFPRLAQVVAKQDSFGLSRAYGEGLQMIFAITVPAAVGLIVLREPIIGLLLRWGQFEQADVLRTAPILVVFALALPLYAFATYATRGFHALQDMRTPVRIAAWTFAANLVLSLALMFWLGTIGLALASLGSSLLQTAMLHVALVNRDIAFARVHVIGPLLKIGVAAAAMGILCEAGRAAVELWVGTAKIGELVTVVLIIPPAVLIYFGILLLLGFEQREEVLDLFREFLRGRSKDK